jgi:hypothetical protein
VAPEELGRRSQSHDEDQFLKIEQLITRIGEMEAAGDLAEDDENWDRRSEPLEAIQQGLLQGGRSSIRI